MFVACRQWKVGKFITMTSQWARWRLKSPTSRLFTQVFIQTQIKENIKAPRHWPLASAQRASNAENVSTWWRHHLDPSSMLAILIKLQSGIINAIQFRIKARNCSSEIRNGFLCGSHLGKILIRNGRKLTWSDSLFDINMYLPQPVHVPIEI